MKCSNCGLETHTEIKDGKELCYDCYEGQNNNKCKECNGKGSVLLREIKSEVFPVQRDYRKCSACNGTGERVLSYDEFSHSSIICGACSGTGQDNKEYTVEEIENNPDIEIGWGKPSGETIRKTANIVYDLIQERRENDR